MTYRAFRLYRTAFRLLLGALALAAAATGPARGQSAPADTTAGALAAPDVAPELVTFVEAEYPPAALREGREGTVLLDLFVTAAGRVDSVSVARSLAPDLDRAAAAAAAQFEFAPAVVGGEPVPVYVQFEYVFSIRDASRRIEQYVNLSGRLREMGTRAPLDGAMVVAALPDSGRTGALDVPLAAYLERIGGFAGQYLEDGRLVTFTDRDGRFAFRSLPPGAVVLTFPNAGYELLEERVEVRAAELVAIDCWVRRSAYNEYEIVVYGRAEEREVTRQSLSVVEVERVPGFGGDVIKSIQALPGVARPTMDDPGAIVIRGSGNFDTRFFLDGIDIPLLFHYGGVKSTYSSLALASVDLYPGGFGTRYGNCTGGVVELKGRAGRSDRWHGVFDASTLDASFHVEGPLARDLTVLVTGRRSFVGELMDLALRDSKDVDLAIAPYYWDVVGRLDWDPTPDHHLFLTGFAVQDRMAMLVPDEAMGSPEVNTATDAIEMDIRFSRLILGSNWRLGRAVRNELRAAYGYQGERGHVFGEFDWDGHGDLGQVRDELRVDWTGWLGTSLGGEFIATPYSYEVQAAGWPRAVQTKTFGQRGGWFNVDLWLGDDLQITPGVRYDYYTHIADDIWSARSAARWQYAPTRAITASYGSYNQMPQPAGQSTDTVYGNPDLPPTEAVHATLGHEWRLGDRVFFKTEVYHNRQDQIPSPTDSLGLNFVPDTEARMYGVEFLLRHEPTDRFFGWLSYSLGRSERRYARRPSTDIGPDWDASDWVLYDLDQTHHLEAVGSWNLGGNWSVGARVQYVTGVPVTPNLSYTSQRFEFDADTGEYVPVGGEYFGERMAPYVRTDLRIDKTWVHRATVWSAYLDLQNANAIFYNSPEGYTYNYDYSQRNDYGWIFMPAIGLRVEY